jgi:hypothetical protein
MKKTTAGYCCIAVLIGLTGIALALSPSEKQQVDNFKVSTLKGLHSVAVKVIISREGPDTLPFLTEVGLQKEVEFVLHNAPTPEAGLYVVVVKITAATKDKLNFAMDVRSSLSQIVQLLRDQTIKTEAQTWPGMSQGRFGIVPITIAKTTIEKTVKEQATDFANDWKAANPKQ